MRQLEKESKKRKRQKPTERGSPISELATSAKKGRESKENQITRRDTAGERRKRKDVEGYRHKPRDRVLHSIRTEMVLHEKSAKASNCQDSVSNAKIIETD